MKNSVKKLFIVAVAVFVTVFSAGCTVNISEVAPAPYVVSIEKTSSEGFKDTYTITYSDGTTSTFEITNGKDGVNGADGKDGLSPSVDELYEKYLEENPDASYNDFLESLNVVAVTDETEAVGKALLSSAKVFTEFTEKRQSQFMVSNETALYSGSAVIYRIDEDYTYFITNYHVVFDKSAVETDKIAKKIVCYLYGSEGAPKATNEKDEGGCAVYDYGDYAVYCDFVGGSITNDIAVLKAETSSVKGINPSAIEAEFASDYTVGETAIAVGNPENEGISVTRGIVSVDNEYITLAIDGTARNYRSIRIDTSIYQGSSGGGLFNKDGKLIGITNAGDGTDQNVNYAVPLQIVKGTVENVLFYKDNNDGKGRKITLGVTVRSVNSRYVYDVNTGKGKIVEDVTVDSIIENSIIYGLEVEIGDKMTEFIINGESLSISRLFNIGDALLRIREGDEISFKLIRNGEETYSLKHTVTKEELAILA